MQCKNLEEVRVKIDKIEELGKQMNILQEITEKRKIDIARRKEKISLNAIKMLATKKAEQEKEKQGEFLFPFQSNLSKEGIQFICEVKKASPSKGIIAQDFPYLEIAQAYEEAGAVAISVLTEPAYFLGSDEYLKEIVEKVKIPVLRKDFTIDAYQIYEAKMLGASAVLLICSLLEEETLSDFLEIAHSLGLSALVETHNEEEIKRALSVGAKIIGVNNRDLKNFTVDITNSIRLRKLVPKDVLFISESGIQTAQDIATLKEHGVNGVLMGESFMRCEDKKKKMRELNG